MDFATFVKDKTELFVFYSIREYQPPAAPAPPPPAAAPSRLTHRDTRSRTNDINAAGGAKLPAAADAGTVFDAAKAELWRGNVDLTKGREILNHTSGASTLTCPHFRYLLEQHRLCERDGRS